MSKLTRTLLSLVAAFTLLATPATADPTTAVTDDCGAQAGTGAVATGQDICSIAIETVQAGVDPDTGEELTTILDVTMTLAGDPQELPSAFQTVWGAGDCGFIPFQTDHLGTGEFAALHVYCGDRLEECTTTSALCDQTHEFEQQYPVDVTFGDNTVTWTIAFDGALGEDFGDLHQQGDVIGVGGLSAAGPSWNYDTPLATFACGSDTGCHEPLGDFAIGGTPFTI